MKLSHLLALSLPLTLSSHAATTYDVSIGGLTDTFSTTGVSTLSLVQRANNERTQLLAEGSNPVELTFTDGSGGAQNVFARYANVATGTGSAAGVSLGRHLEFRVMGGLAAGESVAVRLLFPQGLTTIRPSASTVDPTFGGGSGSAIPVLANNFRNRLAVGLRILGSSHESVSGSLEGIYFDGTTIDFTQYTWLGTSTGTGGTGNVNAYNGEGGATPLGPALVDARATDASPFSPAGDGTVNVTGDTTDGNGITFNNANGVSDNDLLTTMGGELLMNKHNLDCLTLQTRSVYQ